MKAHAARVGIFGASVLAGLAAHGSCGATAAQAGKGSSEAVPAEVRAACELARGIASRTPGVSIVRSEGELRDEALREPVLGCRLEVSGSFARAKETGDAVTRLRDGFAARGWDDTGWLASDGKDGTSFAFRMAGVACLFRGEWDGGADGGPEIPPEDWYRITVTCTNRLPAGGAQR